MNDFSTIGEKIKKYRTDKGLSQLELELEINTSPGRISKIENNQINPDKETIINIANALELDDREIAHLFGIEISTSSELMTVVNELSEMEDIEKIMIEAVDKLSKHLNYLTVSIFLLEEDTLWHKYYSSNPLTDKAIRVSGKKARDMHINMKMKDGSKNLLLKSALEGKTYESDNFVLFGIGVVNPTTLKIMEQVIRFKQGLTIPLITKNKSIGSMFFVKQYTSDYRIEIPLLEAVARQIAIILDKAKQ